MNRQELQTMIDSTIVPNKKKGITAESLRLVLSEMANATPEGGSGNLDVINIYWPVVAEDGFNDDVIEGIISVYADTYEINEDELRSYLKGMLAKNAEAFKRIIETKRGKDILCVAVGISIDEVIVDAINKQYEDALGFKLYESAYSDVRIPVICTWGYVDFTEEASEKINIPDSQVVEFGSFGYSFYATLNPDGSLVFNQTETEQPSSDNGDIVFVCTERIDEELTPEQKTHNIEMLNRIKNAEVKPSASIAIPSNFGSGTFTTNHIALQTTYMSDPELGDIIYMAVFAGGAFQEAIVKSDGTIEIFAE